MAEKDSSLRVAFLVGSLEAGGLERFVTRVSLKAREQNVFEPIVICLNRKSGVFLQALETQKIEVEAARPDWYRSVAGILFLKRLIERLNVDIVHSQVNYSILQQFIAARLAGKKFTITERSSYQRKGLGLLRRRIQYFCLKAAGVAYSANSRPVAAHLARMLKEPLERFSVIPNGISVGESRVNVAARRRELGIGVDEVLIGYVARMDPPKGHRLFIDVLNKLVNERGLPIKTVFVGDGSLRKEIETRLSELGLTSHVVFAGVVSDVENWMPMFDIVALLSNREGMPNVVIEAMAAGKPVVGTAVGNIPELIGEGAGVVVNEGDVNSIANEFERLIRDEELRNRLGAHGIELVRNKYSLEITLKVLGDYYDSILKQGR